MQVIFNAKLLVDYVRILFSRYLQMFRAAPTSIIGGQIFIYSCSAQLISFEIDCFYGLVTRICEYLPAPPPPNFRARNDSADIVTADVYLKRVCTLTNLFRGQYRFNPFELIYLSVKHWLLYCVFQGLQHANRALCYLACRRVHPLIRGICNWVCRVCMV